MDYPDEKLKSHVKPIPSTGGLGIVISTVIGVALTFQYNLDNQNIAVMVFLSGIFLLGILDDRFNLKALSRLLIQTFLVSLLLLFISPLNISGFFILDFAISIIFCVACINAINLLDIMDGLAAGVSFFAILNCLIFLNSEYVFYILISICTLISLLSFLIFNFNPASIFMGDAGSTLLGGLIAVLVLVLFQQATTVHENISYLLPVSVMLFDLLFVVIIRIKKGLNPMMGSPDHLALRLRKIGFSVKKTILIIYSFSAICFFLSIAVLYSPYPLLLINAFFTFLLFVSFKMSKVIVD
ncbi:MraY family glycosyltransferase [Psychrobacter sp. FDAARGOS_221]|uniref:MraY family glycosyltransferase n=1 Tax=Psychrobacter sp. FDAARGOS_221 TaxID=1975705 RepID=UPI000BB58583|nr:MraY family glycosyltransferase [Psychrobacter sp. FDAARGOS_221]PNK61169.1 undecaprenyl/decaprenyl-phosphate alpha-N-acetylglucosaminyl 1-phosphate transferase [Psychrobacter sp. FDAARGOS_221]